MKKIIISLLLILQTLYCEILISDESKVNLTNKAQIYIEEKSKKDIIQIINNPNLFKKSLEKKIYKGLTTDTIWFKFTIKNTTNKPINKTLYINAPLYNATTFFTVEKDTIISKKGLDLSSDLNETLYPYFYFSLKEKEKKTYYLKVDSNISALNFSLFILNKNEIYKKERNHQLILAIFFGAILILVLYNLSLFVFTKESSFFYYGIYFILLVSYYAYYTDMYLFITDKYFLHLGIYFLSFLTIFIILFTRSFLQIKQHKNIDKIFKIMIVFLLLIVLFTNKDFYPLSIVVLILLSCLLLVISISYYLFFKGNPQAKYFILGWTISLIGYISLAMYNYGQFSLINHFKYFYETTIIVEALLFSMALSSRLNKTKELENSLKRNDLLTRELHHRIKNNMQFIISLYRLNLSSHMNEELNKKIINVENTVKAMSHTHELLYNQENLDKLDIQNYFYYIVKELKRSYDFSKIKINYEIQTDVDISKSIVCGIILNELITNSLKYAFKENEGIINVILRKENKKTVFIIEDNGIGFNKNETPSNKFGLKLVSSLVQNELDGDIKIESENRTKIIITL